MTRELRKKLNNQRGLTLVEIMIVLVILGGLIGFLAPRVIGGKDKANQRLAKNSIEDLRQQLEIYSADCGDYPSSENGLTALLEDPGDDCPNWMGPYVNQEKQIKDPWGTEFVYEADGSDYTITSLGKDRRPGGDGYDRDISSGTGEKE